MIQILNSRYFLNENNQVINSENGNILKGGINNAGYNQIGLNIDKVNYSTSIHRIVAHCYLGLDLRDGKTEVDHIDQNKLNNHPSNLRLCSKLENRNFNSKYELPDYISKNSNKNYKQGFIYTYRRRINGEQKTLKVSVNLDVVLKFKEEYEK